MQLAGTTHRAKLCEMKLRTDLFLGLLAVIVVVVWAAVFARVFKVSSQELAAWAQGIGTVAAIGATMLATNRQIEAVREERRAERAELIIALRDAAAYAVDVFYSIDQVLPHKSIYELRVAINATDRTWSSVFENFLEMPVEKWPSAFIYLRARQFFEAHQQFDRYTNTMLAIDDIGERHWSRLNGFRSRLAGALEIFDDVCAARLEKLG